MSMQEFLLAGLDLLLCAGLLWLAWQVIQSPGLVRSVILFMVFGLLMALVWARLGAPDLALAEAAIGAGITGALLLSACKTVANESPGKPNREVRDPAAPGVPDWLLAPLCAAAGIGLAVLMHHLGEGGGPTPEAAIAAAGEHILGNPVTAVLLDFRAHDTLLEMLVLLLAFLGGRILLQQRPLPAAHPPPMVPPPMLMPLVTIATPFLLVTSFYVFWAGSHSPGGAFQAGALLGALGVMYHLAGRLSPIAVTGKLNRWLLAMGLGIFTLSACLGLFWAGAPLALPDRGGYALVLVIEFALMLSIATTLAFLFAGTRGLRLQLPPLREPQ